MMKVKPFSEVKLKTALLRGKQAKKRFRCDNADNSKV